MRNLQPQEENEKFYHLLMAFCHRVSVENPTYFDAIKAIREQAEKEYKTGLLFTEKTGENMWNKYLAPFKEIAKGLKISVKGTPEERVRKQLEVYTSTEKTRKTANAAIFGERITVQKGV